MTAGTGPDLDRQALSVHVAGVVQGVGFRPFVHRLAVKYNLAGWVRNESGTVRIEIEGPLESITPFLADLRSSAPPLACIDCVETRVVPPRDLDAFQIILSATQPARRQPICPDIAICAACEAELFDGSNRRYRYPFITCTDCGPRFTIIESMPYDRERTSMTQFAQCPQCREEYQTPEDRRYHSETNSCHECGPRLSLVLPGQNHVESDDRALASAARLLSSGKIVAVRGLGGFHLAVDATSDAAVRRLRRRKHREAKPFAIMVRDLEQARAIGQIGLAEKELLLSRQRPIVLLDKGPFSKLASSLAPGLSSVGVMTAYTPLHLLLLDLVKRPLVMTSGNKSEEPIACANSDALKRLGRIADAFLLHDREIVSRYDDSVVRVISGKPVFLRRARGYAPLPLDLPVVTPRPLLAVGPHLKNTFTLAEASSAYVSQHIGDLDNLETLEHFRNTFEGYRRLFGIEPEVAVCDLHPGYLSTRVAEELNLARIIRVQHHHAHVAAVAAEHNVTGKIVGLAYDGTGYGEDGKVWGAETLIADFNGYKRVGRLRYAPLPGGDLAVRQPWRSALGYFSLQPEMEASFRRILKLVPAAHLAIARQQVRRGLNSPLASSMGRLFDAAAAVLGVRQVAYYEGQAAMELETLAGDRPGSPLPFPVEEQPDGTWVLDPLPLLVALSERCAHGDDVGELASRFHESVASSSSTLVNRVCEASGIQTVALSGGVFQNARLAEAVRAQLAAQGLRVLVPRRLSPNDGAISFGQAVVAASLLSSEGGN